MKVIFKELVLSSKMKIPCHLIQQQPKFYQCCQISNLHTICMGLSTENLLWHFSIYLGESAWELSLYGRLFKMKEKLTDKPLSARSPQVCIVIFFQADKTFSQQPNKLFKTSIMYSQKYLVVLADFQKHCCFFLWFKHLSCEITGI